MVRSGPTAVIRLTDCCTPQPTGRPQSNSHTILLYQLSPSFSSCSYMQFDSVGDAMNGICNILADRLRKQRRVPSTSALELTLKELLDFIDSVTDMGALVYVGDLQPSPPLTSNRVIPNHGSLKPNTNTYTPHDKEWIKVSLSKHLIKKRS